MCWCGPGCARLDLSRCTLKLWLAFPVLISPSLTLQLHTNVTHRYLTRSSRGHASIHPQPPSRSRHNNAANHFSSSRVLLSVAVAESSINSIELRPLSTALSSFVGFWTWAPMALAHVNLAAMPTTPVSGSSMIGAGARDTAGLWARSGA